MDRQTFHRIILSILTLTAPFLCVWIAYCLTGGVFVPSVIFKHEGFWAISALYWVAFQWFLYATIWDW